MSTRSKPKTKSDWREDRLKKAKQENGYIRIPMELWNGEAFHALSKSEKLMVIECLAQLRYAPKTEKKRNKLDKKNILHCGLGHLTNRGEFGLPTKCLQERGIKGEDTIARAKKRLVQVGFLDVVVQGSFTKAARFRYSDRWRTYGSGQLTKQKGTAAYDGQLPGYCLYPNILQFNDKRNDHSENDDFLFEDVPIQLDLFKDYGSGATI